MLGFGKDIVIEVRVIPRAQRNEVDGHRDGRLLVRTIAPPVGNVANNAVRQIIADHYGVRKRSVTIVSGQHSRDKTLRVQHV
jgi:uncharacterized protein (TIGR00251 family)